MTAMIPDEGSTRSSKESLWDLFFIFLRLGLTSFGGPIAHLSYFREEFVSRRRWLSERSYADLIALCQFLPGPASSQVGIAIGISRHGYRGALASWAGFTLPSAIALILFAYGISRYGEVISPTALQGLQIVAVAVVAQAVWGMARHLCNDVIRMAIMVVAACATLAVPGAMGQVAIIVVAAVVGMVIFSPKRGHDHEPLPINIRPRSGVIWLAIFFVLLIGLPWLASFFPYQVVADINSFFRIGSMVFGGGHVVLPLLQAEVVPTGLISNDAFLAGYGAAQAIPGPLFSFAAFLGASMRIGPTGWSGGCICLIAIFAPSFLLVAGVIPFWENLRANTRVQAALAGVNSAVVGILLAALYQPVWTTAIHQPRDFGIAVLAFVALVFWKLPPWLVVLSCGLGGSILGLL